MGGFFFFWGMGWLGLHVHSDNSAVVAMLSRWSAKPVCVLRCLYFYLSLIIIGWISLVSIFSGVSNVFADALARSKVRLFPSLILHIPRPLWDPFVNRQPHWVDRFGQGVHGYIERSLG